MNRVAIVYWSGTGNTQAMANCIAQGAREAGAQADLLDCADFSSQRLDDFDVVAFGCPSMGVETLEEAEFEPMFAQLERELGGRRIALFGSYGWGDGQWMRDWCERCREDGAILHDDEGLIVHETPDPQGEDACRALGRALAAW